MTPAMSPILRARARSALKAKGSLTTRWWRDSAIVAIYTWIFFGALPLLLWGLGKAFDRGLALSSLPSSESKLVSIALLIAGIPVVLASMGSLIMRGRGLPISHLPPKLLVARGLYAWMRHPIYVGYTAVFAGVGILDQSIGRGVLAPLLLTVGWVIYALAFEEPRLHARFGPSYAHYTRSTPLFPIPFARRLVGVATRIWLAMRPGVELLANRTVLFRAGREGHGVWVTYGALVALGGVMGAATDATLLAGWGLSAGRIALYQLALTASMLAGGRLVWLAYEWRRIVRDPSIIVRRVGFVSFGGYLGFLAFTIVFAKASGLDVLGLLDRSVPPAFLISALGRLGCLSYGCCYGRTCGAHGLRWTDPASKVNRERGDATRGAPRIPTPLLSAVIALVAAASGLVVLLARKDAMPSAPTATTMLVYASLRFGAEHWRDEARLSWAPLTKGQLLTLPIAILAIGLWLALLLRDGSSSTPTMSVHVEPSVLLTLWPAFVAIFAGAFLVCGYHRREVGQW